MAQTEAKLILNYWKICEANLVRVYKGPLQYITNQHVGKTHSGGGIKIRVLFTIEILLLYGEPRNTVRCKSSGRELQQMSVSVIHKTLAETDA